MFAAPAGLWAMALSAGDKASCSVMTRVPSLKTTVTDLGTWLPVRRCSKAIAARAICLAKVELDLLISVILGGRDRSAPPKAIKKADVVGHHRGVQLRRRTRQRA